MSISTRGRVHFGIYLLNRKFFVYETWLTDKNSNRQFFWCIFCMIRRIKP